MKSKARVIWLETSTTSWNTGNFKKMIIGSTNSQTFSFIPEKTVGSLFCWTFRNLILMLRVTVFLKDWEPC